MSEILYMPSIYSEEHQLPDYIVFEKNEFPTVWTTVISALAKYVADVCDLRCPLIIFTKELFVNKVLPLGARPYQKVFCVNMQDCPCSRVKFLDISNDLLLAIREMKPDVDPLRIALFKNDVINNMGKLMEDGPSDAMYTCQTILPVYLQIKATLLPFASYAPSSYRMEVRRAEIIIEELASLYLDVANKRPSVSSVCESVMFNKHDNVYVVPEYASAASVINYFIRKNIDKAVVVWDISNTVNVIAAFKSGSFVNITAYCPINRDIHVTSEFAIVNMNHMTKDDVISTARAVDKLISKIKETLR